MGKGVDSKTEKPFITILFKKLFIKRVKLWWGKGRKLLS